MHTYSPADHATYLRYTKLLNGGMAIIACTLGLWILLTPSLSGDARWLYLLVWPIATLHTVEEYIFPGGFLRFFNREAFASPSELGPLTARRAFFTDAVAGLVNPVLLVLLGTFFLPGVWFFVGLLTINGAFHLVETLKRGSYFPGVATAVLLYFPGLGAITWYYLQAELISPVAVAIAFGVAMLATGGFFWQVRVWRTSDAQAEE